MKKLQLDGIHPGVNDANNHLQHYLLLDLQAFPDLSKWREENEKFRSQVPATM